MSAKFLLLCHDHLSSSLALDPAHWLRCLAHTRQKTKWSQLQIGKKSFGFFFLSETATSFKLQPHAPFGTKKKCRDNTIFLFANFYTVYILEEDLNIVIYPQSRYNESAAHITDATNALSLNRIHTIQKLIQTYRAKYISNVLIFCTHMIVEHNPFEG